MRGRPVLHRIELGAWEPSMLREVLLALFFLAGALAGHVYALCCDEGAQAELGRYLRDFCAVYDAGGTASSLWSCAVLYFGGGVLVFLLGFSCAGVALIPALAALFGFLSMYTVSCFVRCFGRAGVVLAMGLMGIRLLFTLPCFFALADKAWPLSTELFALSFGRGKRSAPVLYGSQYVLLLVLCLVILAVGVCCERLAAPLLFRLALGEVL